MPNRTTNLEPLSEDIPIVETQDVRVEESSEDTSNVCNLCEEIAEEDNYNTDYSVDGIVREVVCDDCIFELYNCYSCEEGMTSDYEELQYNSNGDPYCSDCYYDRYSHCYDCGSEVHNDYVFWSEDNEEPYCEECYSNLAADVDLDSYSVRNTVESESFDNISSSRMVGLEIECYSDGWNYWEESDVDGNWRSVHDGSISAFGDGSRGVEFVSRYPVNGDRLYQDIEYITGYLNNDLDFPFSVNKSCGVHVHVDGRDLDWRGLKAALLIGKSAQDIIYKMMPPSRDQGRWCKRIPLSRRQIMEIDSDQSFIDSWYGAWHVNPSMEKYNDSRYCGMNMHARIIHGSVEFRYHSGTTNLQKILNWVKICTAIVDRAYDIQTNAPSERLCRMYQVAEKRNFTFKEFFQYVVRDPSVELYARNRIKKFYDYNKKEDYEAMEFII
jgi:hypothetical protein